MAHVALDLRALVAPPTGQGRYTAELIRGLRRVAPRLQLSGFAHRPLHDGAAASLEGVAVVTDRRWPSGLLWQQLRLPRLLRRSGAEVFHGLLYTLPLRSPIPTVVTIADVTTETRPRDHTAYNRFVASRIMRASARRADVVLAVSRSTRDEIERLGWAEAGRVRVVHEAASALFRPARSKREVAATRARVSGGSPFVLTVGTIEPRKNIPALLAAHARLRAELGSAAPPLVLAGGAGWGSAPLRAALPRTLGVDGVVWLGRIDDAALAALYRACAVFVYPSFEEGFGLPVLEAMASGVPVVTSDRSSLPEVAGGAARLVPPDDPSALAHAIRGLLTDVRSARAAVRSGLARAKQFSWDRAARETIDAYRAALAVRV